MSKGSGKFFVGALIGAAAGAIAGILFAPKSGKETRKIIKDKASEYAEKGKDAVVEKEKEAADAIRKVADKISK